MTDFLEQYARQFRAAAEAEAARGRRVPVAPLAVAGLAAAAVGVAVFGSSTITLEQELEQAPPVTRAGAGYDRQQAMLGVLRERTKADSDPQVRTVVRDYADVRPRAARLLGKADSGGAYVLMATHRYAEPVPSSRPFEPGVQPEVRWHPDGLCLVRRGTQGGGGHCTGTAGLLAGELHGAMAGEVYGVVPDGVTHVIPPRRDRPVRVRRNFYSYPARGHPGPFPIWLDADGDEVPTVSPPGQLPYVNVGGHGGIEHLRGQVTVLGLWASWCDPCEPQLLVLEELEERLRETGSPAQVVGVATADETRAARRELERLRIRFAVLGDRRETIARRFGVDAIPETLVLDADGKVAARFRGPASVERLEAAVSRAR